MPAISTSKKAVSYTHLRAHETDSYLVCRLLLEKIRPIFKTSQPVVIFPSSGTGAWEAALVNTLSPGDKVLMYETGQFSNLWIELASRLGLEPEICEGDWRGGAIAEVIEERLLADKTKPVSYTHLTLPTICSV